MRFVEVEGHTRVAWYQTSGWGGVAGLAIVLAAMPAAMSALMTYGWVGCLSLLAVAGAASIVSMHQHEVRYRMLELGAQGLTLATLRHRSLNASWPQPTVDFLRQGESDTFLFGSDADPQRIAYADIAAMGHTDFSLWLEPENGERIEVRLDCYSRTEIERLFQRIHPIWQRVRAGVADDLEANHRHRDQVRALTHS